jgi:transcriptional regulator with XRE-family HTH domain
MANLAILIGNRIRELRKARDLRQEDMAGFGLSYKYYQRIEAGKVNMTLKTLEKIAGALGVDAAELLALPLAKSQEVNEMIAVVTEIVKADDRKTAMKVNLFVKEFIK